VREAIEVALDRVGREGEEARQEDGGL
jgi:hypothetical protein